MIDALLASLRAELTAHADAPRAVAMAAYMKTDQPFYGVIAPTRRAIGKAAARRFRPTDRAGYEAAVAAVWALPEREAQYLAIQLALAWQPTPASIPLFRRLIVEGAWWDTVDELAVHVMGGLLAREPAAVWPWLDAWIDDPDLWLRRTALLAQNRQKAATDADRLFAWCRKRADEKDFFIRKAIGWALRTYAATAPEAVAAFLVAERPRLSGLSFREASKHLSL
ncbi:MAG: DNA alkylation repair protein [Myxococcales bacterium]|nr:DNA alkylation repair protein [Myxococcales bacterium]